MKKVNRQVISKDGFRENRLYTVNWELMLTVSNAELECANIDIERANNQHVWSQFLTDLGFRKLRKEIEALLPSIPREAEEHLNCVLTTLAKIEQCDSS